MIRCLTICCCLLMGVKRKNQYNPDEMFFSWGEISVPSTNNFLWQAPQVAPS